MTSSLEIIDIIGKDLDNGKLPIGVFLDLSKAFDTSLEIIDIIGKDLDNGKLPIGVFFDLSKAFDTLDHTILLDKLLYYGIKGT